MDKTACYAQMDPIGPPAEVTSNGLTRTVQQAEARRLPPDGSTPSWCPLMPEPVAFLNSLGFKTLGQSAAEKGGEA